MVAIFCALSKSSEPITILSVLKKSSIADPSFRNSGLKTILSDLMFAIIKAIVTRYRYDQLMRLGWKVFLPFSLIYVVLTASFLIYFDLLPNTGN